MSSSFKSRIYYHVLKRRLAKFRALNLPLTKARALRDRDSSRVFKMPSGIRCEAVRIAGLSGEWLRPVAAQGSDLLMYLHGGAYVQGSINTHRALASRLALASASSAFIFDYRLAPEHPYPAALDDAYSIYTALRSAHLGVPIAIVGDSAGGGLALALALRIRHEALEAPVALALLSPWTDLTLCSLTHKTKASVDPYFPDTKVLSDAARAYANGLDLKTPWMSPQFADLGGLPPTLIHVGEREALLDDSRILAQEMAAQGSPVRLKVFADMWHVWQVFGGLFREADESVLEIGDFLRAHLALPPNNKV